ncbi:MAG: hypothetical protein WCA85_26450 [Paraburkholderia sp.]|uniref:hypothetical protein n=1 Tax=Paraburkholderia sp. TaxID=1926495 RepID=UPI003C3F15E3
MVSTPESYTVQKLCEDFLTGHIERRRDSLGAAQSRRRIVTKIADVTQPRRIGFDGDAWTVGLLRLLVKRQFAVDV